VAGVGSQVEKLGDEEEGHSQLVVRSACKIGAADLGRSDTRRQIVGRPVVGRRARTGVRPPTRSWRASYRRLARIGGSQGPTEGRYPWVGIGSAWSLRWRLPGRLGEGLALVVGQAIAGKPQPGRCLAAIEATNGRAF